MLECGKYLGQGALVYVGFTLAWYLWEKAISKASQWLEQKANQYGFKGPD